MATFITLTRIDGSSIAINAAEIVAIEPVPESQLPLGVAAASYLIDVGSQYTPPNGLIVQGTPAAVAAALAAAIGVVFVPLTRSSDSATIQVQGALILSLEPVPSPVPGGASTQTYLIDVGSVYTPPTLAVNGTVAAVAALLGASSPISGSGGLSKVLFVDPAGDDSTAVRGSLVNRYATIEAALADAQNGDCIQVSPGTYTIAAGPITIPAGLTNLQITGEPGKEQGAIVVFTTGDGFEIPPASGTRLIAGLSIACAQLGQRCIVVGDNVQPAPMTGPELRDLFLSANGGRSLDVFGCSFLRVENCECFGEARFLNCLGAVRECTFLSGLVVGRDASLAGDPGTGWLDFDGGSCTTLTLDDQPQIHTLPNFLIRNEVLATTLAVFAGGAGSFTAPKIVLEGSVGDPGTPGFNGDLTFDPLPTFDPLNPTIIQIRLQALVAGLWTFNQVAAAPATPIDADRSGPFELSTVSCGGNAELSIRGVPPIFLLAAGGGAPVDRDFVTATAFATVIGANNVPIDPPLPNNKYTGNLTGDTAGMDLIGGAKTASQFTFTSAAVGTTDVLLTRTS